LTERTASAVLLTGLAALFIMALISMWLSWDQSQQAVAARLSNDLRSGTVALFSAVQESHIAQNAYVARGDRNSLETLDHAWLNVEQNRNELRVLINEESQHRVAFRTVESLIEQRMRTYRTLKAGGTRIPADEASLAEIGNQLKQINAVETADVMQNRRDVAASRAWLVAGTTLTALFASLLCFGAYSLIRRRLHILAASERVLSAFNAELEANVSQRTAELEQAKADVEREKSRAEALLSDLNHRVGNSLQIVSSLVNMHAARVGSSEARAILEAVGAHVRAIASAQRRIRLVGTSDRVDLSALLGSLIDDMKALGTGETFTIVLDAGDATVSSNDAISISVIVMEAISNAIKYASAGDTFVTIRVSLIADDEKRPVKVTVEDNGIGFDDGSATPGLGSEVTGALAASLRARLVYEHVDPQAARRGTRVVLDFEHAGGAVDAL
jgi:two-component sensor histidine kinase